VVKDHGRWEIYRPANPKLFRGQSENAPMFGTLMYSRRVDTHADWYDYVHTLPKDSVMMTVLVQPDGKGLVQVATRDHQRLFPGDGYLIEETGYGGEDPQADFAHRVYDPKTKILGHKHQFPLHQTETEKKILDVLGDIVRRIEALECKTP